MAQSDSPSTGFSRAQRWLTFLNLLLATTAALALCVMANYFAQGHYKRVQLAEYSSFQLSPQTLRVLKSLTNDVNVTIFYQRSDDDLYLMICGLLTEYQNASPHIKLSTLDYESAPTAASELISRLHLANPNQRDFIAFECNGHQKIVSGDELSDFNISDVVKGQTREIRRTQFFGELRFTDAIYAVTYPREMKAYFLAGHGELEPGRPGDTPEANLHSVSKLAAILTNEISCPWQPLLLTGTNPIPVDCKLLIIATPRDGTGRLTSNELTQIENYLEKDNGRLLALLGNNAGLDSVLTNHWDLYVGPSGVVEQDKDFQVGTRGSLGIGFLARPAMDPTKDSMHPIIRPLASEQMKIVMIEPRPIFTSGESSSKPGAATITPLIATTSNSYQVSPDSKGDLKMYGPHGPFPLLAAVEQGVITGGDGTRMVVAGNADFLSDALIDSANNHKLASQILNWLLQRNEMVMGDVGPRAVREYHLNITDGQQRQLEGLFLGIMPGAVLLLGGLVWLRRRS